MARTGGPEERPGRVRLRDVAELARVDISVVSRTLNDHPRLSIRPETRQRILDAAAELGYRPNSAARSLKLAKTMALGLIVPDVRNVAYAAITEGAEERALETGYVLVVAPGSITERVRMLEGRVDGLLIATATSEWIVPEHVPRTMRAVLINRREAGSIPSVTVDDEMGAAQATKYLIELGHRRLGHVAGPQNTDTARRRKAGFVESLLANGLPLEERWVAQGPYSESGGYSAALRILKRKPRPTALFATNLMTTIGAMAAIRRLGLRIPGDISIVGYDDSPLAMYLEPPLTTVRMPLREMGAHAVDVLLSVIAGEKVDDVMLDIPPELVVRGSAAAPPNDS
jgi:LacI family transcriptional regulator